MGCRLSSQQPAASFLSQEWAASTVQILGLPLFQWVVMPERWCLGVSTLMGDSIWVFAIRRLRSHRVSSSPLKNRLKRSDKFVLIWKGATLAEVGRL